MGWSPASSAHDGAGHPQHHRSRDSADCRADDDAFDGETRRADNTGAHGDNEATGPHAADHRTVHDNGTVHDDGTVQDNDAVQHNGTAQDDGVAADDGVTRDDSIVGSDGCDVQPHGSGEPHARRHGMTRDVT